LSVCRADVHLASQRQLDRRGALDRDELDLARVHGRGGRHVEHVLLVDVEGGLPGEHRAALVKVRVRVRDSVGVRVRARVRARVRVRVRVRPGRR
jgi:hypothetical protein